METNEEYLIRLLRPLDVPPSRPSTVDVDRAVLDGRRRKRVRRTVGLVAAVTAAMLVLVAVPVAAGALRAARPPAVAASGVASPSTEASPTASPTQAPPASPSRDLRPAVPVPPTACHIERLPLPKGQTMSLVTGADPTGRYIVGRSYPSGAGEYPIIIWHDGQFTVVNVPGTDQSFSDITSSGDAVGVSFAAGGSTAWAYLGGKLTKLAGANAEARAISASGTIVGSVDDRAVRWRPGSREPERLATPPGSWQGKAYGIDDDGTIVGTLRSAGGAEGAYVWSPDGSVHPLPQVVVAGKHSQGSRGFDLHGGWATGLALLASNDSDDVAVRWNVATGETHVYADVESVAEAANQAGWVVGTNAKGYAVLVTDTGTMSLPPLNSRVEPMDNIASTISDDGRTIAGQAVLADPNRTIVAVVWRCS